MISINIVGSGNVGTQFAKAFSLSGKVRLQQLYSRRADGFSECAADVLHDLSGLRPADVTVLSVSDDAVAEVASALPFSGSLVVHMSGSLPMDILDGKNRRGVFYPLQTLSKSKPVDFSDIPLCLEAENEADLKLLRQLASLLSESVHEVDSRQRKALHVAAVFAGNFTNHMYRNAQRICEDNRLDFALLKPLIRETADKVMTLSPSDAQTGPARRNDQKTIAAHLDFLGHSPRAQVYELLTQSIRNDQL